MVLVIIGVIGIVVVIYGIYRFSMGGIVLVVVIGVLLLL